MATILVVDDRPSNRQFLTTLLGYAGHELLEAANGAEALAQVRARRPDLVITDILMPTMDGYDFVQNIRSDPELASLEVIFYTASYSAPEAAALAESCGVRCVLSKPCEPEKILGAVQRVLGNRAASAGAPPERPEPARPGDTLRPYLRDLGEVKTRFDEVAASGAKPRLARKRLTALSQQFSTNVSRMQRLTARISALIEVGMELTSERDPGRLVELFFSAACDIISSKYAAVGMLDSDESALCHLYTRHLDPGIFRAAEGHRSGFLGLLLTGHDPIRARSPDATGGAEGLPNGHPPVRNVLAVPVSSRERIFGWLYFADRRGAEEFSEEDERLAGIMTAKLAVLYENALLYDIVQRRAAELQLEAAERRRAQEALLESQAGLYRAQKVAKLAHVVTGHDGSFESWSVTLPQLAGVAPEQLPQSVRAWLEIVHPADRDEFRARSIAAGVRGERLQMEYRLRRGDGEFIEVRQFIEPLPGRSEAHGTVRWFSTLQDVTAQKRAEEQLRESELRFRQLAENVNEVFFLVDPATTQMLYVNPAYEEIWGRSIESLYRDPRSWAQAVHPEDCEQASAALAETQASGRFDTEYRIVRPDGSLRWIHARGFPIRDDSGQVYRIAGLAEDITEAKRQADALRESERRFSSLLRNVQLISLMLDGEARITYCNDYFLELTGWRQEEVLGRDWFETFIPPDTEGLSGVFEALLADQPGAWHHSNEILTRSGARRLIQWNNTVLRSASGEVIGTASIGEDITERKEAEDRIRRLNRVYSVLSGINALIVRAKQRDELLRQACDIAVRDGQFPLAWIGLVDRPAMTVKAVAVAGAAMEDFEPIPVGTDGPDAEARGLTFEAFRLRRPAVANDVASDPRIPSRSLALDRGFPSAAVLPLLVSGEVAGVLALYADTPGFFDEQEMKLLEELAGDIAFALEHIAKSEQLDYLAYYDELTGIANRTLFQERVAQQVSAAAKDGRKLAVAYIDIERFKTINDTLGRQGGDALLRQFAARLRDTAGDPAMVARLGADHFAVLVPEVKLEEDLARFLDRWRDKVLGKPFEIGGSELRISTRSGVALFPNDATDAEALLRNAEAALDKAKEAGERRLFYTQEMTERIADRLKLENELRLALDNEEFVLHYQPKVDMETRRVAGVEALIRWQSPTRGLVPPASFIPLLEETRMILDVGAWVLRRAVLDHRHWVRMRLKPPRVAVNVSSIQLRQRDFVGIVEEIVRQGVSPPAVDLEITESLIMEDIEANIAKLRAVSKLGVNVAIDDFGTGYSSLAYLAKLPVNAVKIDRSFIISMLNDADAMTLVQTIISLAHSLRLKVVAEGVDDEEQAKILRLLRCDEMQGYLFSKPLPIEVLMPLLRGDEQE